MGKYSRITAGSMGSHLTPPNHPSQSYQVELDIKRKKENRGGCNLEYAITEEGGRGLDADTILKAKQILSEWDKTKLPLNHQLTLEWIEACKQYMSHKHIEYVKKYYPEYNG